MNLTSPGIILKKIPYGDADEIISVLLKHGGMNRFFVRGSRKSKKRYLGLIDYFAHLKFHYFQPAHGLSRLMNIEEISPSHRNTWSDIKNFAMGAYLAELIFEFTPELAVDHELFDFWLDMQHQLNKDGFSLNLALTSLEKILRQSGYEFEADANHDLASLQNSQRDYLGSLIHYSQNIIQKKSRAADFFLEVLQES